MLHTKYQGHWSFGSREEDIYMVFTLHGHSSHLGHVTNNFFNKSTPLKLWSLHMKFDFNWLSDF